MLDLEQAKANQHHYYANNHYAHGINSITDFAFTDPARVPELFRNFAVEYFSLDKFRRVDLERLNEVLNEIWDGPGSAAKISDLVWDCRIHRRQGNPRVDPLKNYNTPTIDSELNCSDEGSA